MIWDGARILEGGAVLRDFWILVLLACDSDDFLIQDVAESCGQG